ncbi:Alpha/Beta hydrolase protein [Cyathus striatus]|nr:Alpha/Beta hydrolase protein [Cyathus striatus]
MNPLVLFSSIGLALISVAAQDPIVQLLYGTFQGSTTGDLDQFLGIPFAAPPVGNLRLNLPQPPVPFNGIRQATSYGPACLQLNSSIPTSEDCLSINVIKPSTITNGTKLPVLFWLYGGNIFGNNAQSGPGGPVIDRSIALDEPIILVSANYRLGPLGFLGGSEIKSAKVGNLGVRDQLFALEWVQTNIDAFGGDASKVTMWGQSAGSVSIGLHLVLNDGNTNGLFRGAFMESGFPMPLPDIVSQQQFYDQFVNSAGCSGSGDTLSCLRSASTDQINSSVTNAPLGLLYSALNIPFYPSVDGDLITRNPPISIQQGLYANVPVIVGECDDEATCVLVINTTTNAQFLDYMASNFYPGISSPQLSTLEQAYPEDITQVKYPENPPVIFVPQFKRIAAVQGDLFFQAPRRYFLEYASKTQPAYAFRTNRMSSFKKNKLFPVFGSYHGSDGPKFTATGLLPDYIGTDALVNFINTLNPINPPHPNSLITIGNLTWPQWGSSASAPPLSTFVDSIPSVILTDDTYRADAINFLK